MKSILPFVGICSLLILGGCNSLETQQAKLPWSKKQNKVIESDFQQPTRIAAIWSHDVLETSGQPPLRGFGARVFFYNNRGQAIPVEGQLVVYAYDDTDDTVEKRQPDRRFVFPAEKLTRHFSPSDLGASYSIWVSWDEVGNTHRRISLLPVFTSTEGYKVVGQQTMNILPGPDQAEAYAKRIQLRTETFNVSDVVPVTFETSRRLANERMVQRRRPTTIPVSPSMSQRLSAPRSRPGSVNPTHVDVQQVLDQMRSRNTLPYLQPELTPPNPQLAVLRKPVWPTYRSTKRNQRAPIVPRQRAGTTTIRGFPPTATVSRIIANHWGLARVLSLLLPMRRDRPAAKLCPPLRRRRAGRP